MPFTIWVDTRLELRNAVSACSGVPVTTAPAPNGVAGVADTTNFVELKIESTTVLAANAPTPDVTVTPILRTNPVVLDTVTVVPVLVAPGADT